MRPRTATWVSCGLNGVLLAGIIFLWRWPLPTRSRPTPAAPLRVDSGPSPPTAAEPPVRCWADLASEDFHAYRDRLRSIGCPEETLCTILESEIARAFQERRRPLLASAQSQFWERLAAGQGPWTDAEEEAWAQSRDDQTSLVASVLGTGAGAQSPALGQADDWLMERTSWLPAKQQARLVELVRQCDDMASAILTEHDYFTSGVDPQSRANAKVRLRELEQEFQAAKRAILGDNAEEYDLRMASEGHWHDIAPGFVPTESEWRRVTRRLREQGNLSGSSALDEAWGEADLDRRGTRLGQFMDAREEIIRQALGSARYAEFVRASAGN